MAHFYGYVDGSAKNIATRCGTKRSSITSVAASWHGSIRTYMWYDEEEKVDKFEVYQIPWNGKGCVNFLARGIVGQTFSACNESQVCGSEPWACDAWLLGHASAVA